MWPPLANVVLGVFLLRNNCFELCVFEVGEYFCEEGAGSIAHFDEVISVEEGLGADLIGLQVCAVLLDPFDRIEFAVAGETVESAEFK